MNDAGIARNLRPHQSTLIIAALVSLLLWVVPFFGFILLPLQYLNTHLHEFAHAFMAVITGGDVEFIKVFGSGNGVTLASGSPFLVSSAGYLGSIIFGAITIWFSRSEKGASIVLRVLACILLFSFIFWVRGDIIGVATGIVWIGALLAMPSLLKGRHLVLAGQLVGMQQCLSSVQSLYVLLHISAYGGHSDAANLQQFTGIPALVWALIWSVTGIVVLVATLRASWMARPQA